MKEEVLFKKTPFGGFDRQSVINYIQQLKKTQQEYKNIISDKDRLVKTLTEEKNELKERSEKDRKSTWCRLAWKIVTFLLYGTAAVHIIWFHITPMVSDLLIGLCAIMMVISVALYIIQNTRTLKEETV